MSDHIQTSEDLGIIISEFNTLFELKYNLKNCKSFLIDGKIKETGLKFINSI